MSKKKPPLWLRKIQTFLVSIPCMARVQATRIRPLPESDAFRAALAADIHTDADPYRDRTNHLRQCFAGMNKYCHGFDAVVFAGDITNSAHTLEYTLLQHLLQRYFPGAMKKLIPQMGNHDARGTSINKDFPAACTLFQQFCKQCGHSVCRNYYSVQVKGYTFLVLGTEKLVHNGAFFSDEQFLWLEAQLKTACAGEKPVFLICHQPPHDRNGVETLWPDGALGEDSSRLEALLTRYTKNMQAPLVYISGHLHKYSAYTFEQAAPQLYYLNLPSLLFSDEEVGGHRFISGYGFVLEDRPGKLVFQGMNFITGKQHPEHHYEIIYGSGKLSK